MVKVGRLMLAAVLTLALACGDGDDGADVSGAGPGVWVSSYMLFKYTFTGEQKLALNLTGNGWVSCRASDGLVWLVAPTKLLKVSDAGDVLREVPLPADRVTYAPGSMNQNDGSIWFVAVDPMHQSDRRVYRYDVNGNKMVENKACVNPISVACYKGDGSCWVADAEGDPGEELVKLSAAGVVLKKVAAHSPESVAVDDRDGAVWVGTASGELIKYKANGTWLKTINLPSGVLSGDMVAVNPADGAVAVLGSTTNDTYKLIKYNSQGQKRWELGGFKACVVGGLAFNPHDGSIWVCDLEGTAGGKVVKISAAGQKLLTINLPAGATSLAVRP